jgi:hypothetical protein
MACSAFCGGFESATQTATPYSEPTVAVSLFRYKQLQIPLHVAVRGIGVNKGG